MHNNLSCPFGKAASKKEEAFRFGSLSIKKVLKWILVLMKMPTNLLSKKGTCLRGKQLPASL